MKIQERGGNKGGAHGDHAEGDKKQRTAQEQTQIGEHGQAPRQQQKKVEGLSGGHQSCRENRYIRLGQTCGGGRSQRKLNGKQGQERAEQIIADAAGLQQKAV